MDPKRKQLLQVSTGQSLQNFSRFLGINLSSNMGRAYSFIIIVLFVILTYLTWGFAYENLQSFIMKFLIMLLYFMYILLVLSILIISIFHPHQFAFPRQEMSVIDSILESYGARFSDVDIFLMKYLQDVVSVMLVLLTLMKTVYEVVTSKLIYLIWYNVRFWYPVLCLLTMDGLFTHYVNDIYLRFRELNKITILHSREKLLVSCIDFVTANSKTFNKHNSIIINKIRSIQHIHHELYILATKMNTNFGLPLLISSIISLNTIILLLYIIYDNIKLNTKGQYKGDSITTEIIMQIIFVLFFIVRFLYISYICQRSRNESRRMTKILHHVFLKHKSLRLEVVHFSLQLIHEDLIFTGFGLFKIDMSLVCSIATSVLTYLVMTIQLDVPSKLITANDTLNYTENNSSRA